MSIRATNNPAMSLVAGTALAANLLATINASTGVADLCSATLIPIGQTMQTVLVTENQSIRLLSAGSLELTADGAITRGAKVFTAASGKISATAADGTRCVGIALDAAAADGDIIGVLPLAMAAVIVQDLSAITGVAVATTGSTNSTPYGYSQAQADAIVTSLNAVIVDIAAIRADLIAAGIFLT